MSFYNFTIEIASVESDCPAPTNWRDIDIIYEFDYREAKWGDIPSLEFCSADLLATLEAQDICEEVIFRIYATDGKNPSDVYYQGIFDLKELEKDCDREGIFNVPVSTESVLKQLNDNEKERICYLSDKRLQLFQVESGGLYVDDNGDPIEGNFISFYNLANRIYTANGGVGTIPSTGGDTDQTTTVTGNNDTYFPAWTTIIPTSLPGAGVDIQIICNGQYGQQYDVTVTTPAGGWADVTELLEAIRKGFLYYPGQGTISLNLRTWEMYSRMAYATIGDTGQGLGKVLNLYSYWDKTFQVFVGGVANTAWSPAAASLEQRYSNGKDLYISGKGLGAEVCITWGEFKDIVLKMQGSYVSELELGQTIKFQSNAGHDIDIGLTPGFTQPFTDGFNIKKYFDTEYIARQIQPGYAFRLSDYEKDLDTFEFIPTAVIPDKFRVTPPISDMNYIVLQSNCEATFKGNIVLTNIHPSNIETYTLALKVNGIDQDSVSGSIGPNGAKVTIPLIPGFPLLGSYSFNAGDEIEFYLSAHGPNVSAVQGETDWYMECEVCFDETFINEDEANTHVINTLTDFAGCRGVKNEQLDNVYAGPGFAYYQQAEGKQDYSNVFFITYKEIGADRARRFPHELYFDPADPFICTILQGQTHRYYTYNAPIQLPQLISYLRNRIPSGINVPQYRFVNTVSGTGVLSSSVSFVEGPISQSVKRKNIVEFDVCSELIDIYHAYFNSNKIAIEDICGTTQQSICKSIRFNLGTGTMKIQSRI